MDLLIIKITQESISRFENEGDNAVYKAVRSAWRLNIKRAKKAKYILAAKEGKIVGIFKATEWLPCENRQGRFEFKGELASENVQTHLKNVELPEMFKKQGASNPIFYATNEDFNLDENFDNENDAEKQTQYTDVVYNIKGIVSSINIEDKTFTIKGSEGYTVKTDDDIWWNLYKNESDVLSKRMDENIFNYKNEDLWTLISNTFESRRVFIFTVYVNDDASFSIKSIALSDDEHA